MEPSLWNYLDQFPAGAKKKQLVGLLEVLAVDPSPHIGGLGYTVYPYKKASYLYVELPSRIFVAWSVHEGSRFYSSDPVVWIRHIGPKIDHNVVGRLRIR